MPAKRVIVHVDCPSCLAKLPLGGITASITCGACQWSDELPPDKWRWVIDGGDRSVSTLEQIRGETTTSPVACPKCHALVADEMIGTALESGQSSITCAACDNVIPVRPISEGSLGLPTHYSGAIGEGAVQPLSAEKVNFPCSRCGAPLPCDGTTALPTCEFCHTRTPLPEDIWRQLHATGMVHPFFLWATPEAARAAAKKGSAFAGRGRAKGFSGLILLMTAVPVVIGAIVVGVILFRSPNGSAVPRGYGKIHEACDGQDSVCTLDKKNSLRCVNDVWAVALTCKGKNGCRVVNDGESISCDYTIADLGDPCDVKDSACSSDKKLELKCDGIKFVAADTCKGAGGCTMSPSTDGFTLSCDDHIADIGDACLDSRPACSSDKKSMLICREGKLVVDRNCAGPAGCTVSPAGSQTQMSCDEGGPKKKTRR